MILVHTLTGDRPATLAYRVSAPTDHITIQGQNSLFTLTTPRYLFSPSLCMELPIISRTRDQQMSLHKYSLVGSSLFCLHSRKPFSNSSSVFWEPSVALGRGWPCAGDSNGEGRGGLFPEEQSSAVPSDQSGTPCSLEREAWALEPRGPAQAQVHQLPPATT